MAEGGEPAWLGLSLDGRLDGDGDGGGAGEAEERGVVLEREPHVEFAGSAQREQERALEVGDVVVFGLRRNRALFGRKDARAWRPRKKGKKGEEKKIP